MRNVYLGTSDFAATVLRRLADSDHKPVLVVTRPARPKGRGKKLLDPPVAEVARELEIDVFQPDDVNDEASVARIAAAEPQAQTVCAYGAIVKEPLLSMTQSFNVHPSLLPRWRGAAPVERAIAAGDAQTGVTIMQLVEALDSGPMCAQQSVTIEEDDDYGSLAPRLAKLGGELLVAALARADEGEIEWTAQGENGVTYAEKITRDDRLLRPLTTGASELALTIRALTPHIGAMFELDGGDPLRVEEARVTDDVVQAGTATEIDGRLLVGTTSGSLELLRVKPAGGKAMDVESFLRGNAVPQLAQLE